MTPGVGKGSRILIAGAGLAGLRAAQAARAAGHDGEIVLIGDEPHPPYTRPPLSKELLKGEQQPGDCTFPGLDVLDADLRLGTAVTHLDTAAHTVALSDGTELGYGRLIIATGARARTLNPVPGAGPRTVVGTGECALRTLRDAETLGRALEHAQRLAIVGAGFVGCEVAASARARGVAVSLIDVAPRPLLPLGPELGDRCAQLHRDHGVELHLGQPIERLRTDESRVDGVVLADHTEIGADWVLIAVGATPNTDFLHDTPIELAPDGGVVCDATLTSICDPDVLAAGDVAAWPQGGRGLIHGERVRVEHWTTAAEHGRLAGANATRPPEERLAHVTPPYFWSDQYDVKIQSVGFPARADRIEIVEDDGGDPPRLVAEALDADGELVGAVTFNHARRLAEYRRRLAADAH